jgi:hypothetical protein
VLGLLFGQPDRSFYATELIALTGAGSGAVQRELARLEQSGLVTVSRLGTQKHGASGSHSVGARRNGLMLRRSGARVVLYLKAKR